MENKLVTEFEPIPYRIRIGVTGHRKLPDEKAIGKLIRKALDDHIDELFTDKSRKDIADARASGSPPILFTIVTPLAEGTDRLVAKAVMKDPRSRLEAVLPMVEEDYLEDFHTEESRKEFRDLLSLSRSPIRLRQHKISCDAPEGQDQRRLRESAYLNVGQWVVSHCDVLIAIWDGHEKPNSVGTPGIVAFARDQKRPMIRIWAGGGQEILRVEKADGLDATALKAVAAFNAYRVNEPALTKEIEALEREYFEEPSCQISGAAQRFLREEFFPYYIRASRRAKRAQKLFYAAGKVAYPFAALAVLSVAIAVALGEQGRGWYLVELALMAIAVCVVLLAHESQERWMENRFLTERIRCGSFLALCGVDANPIEVLPFMGHAQTPRDWMVRVFDEIWQRVPAIAGRIPDKDASIKRYVCEAWVQSQIAFHGGKAAREGCWAWRLGIASLALPVLTIVLAGVHYGSKLEGVSEKVLTVAAITMPALAAAAAGFRAHREYRRLEKRSAGIIPHLEFLKRRLAATGDPATFERLLHQVDEVMLRETQDWLMLMRFVEVHAA